LVTSKTITPVSSLHNNPYTSSEDSESSSYSSFHDIRDRGRGRRPDGPGRGVVEFQLGRRDGGGGGRKREVADTVHARLGRGA
jgi:hypothetical protein